METLSSWADKVLGEPMVKGGGPYIGKRGGKWADPAHTIPWKESKHAGKPAPKSRPKPGDKDHDGVSHRELMLHIENTYEHYQQHEKIRKDLTHKIATGKYDHAQASKLFEYLADAGSKKYGKDYGNGGHGMDPHTRRSVAREMADDFHDEAQEGEHDHRLSERQKTVHTKGIGYIAKVHMDPKKRHLATEGIQHKQKHTPRRPQKK